MKNNIKWIIIHHSATDRNTTTFEAIKRNHIRDKNLSDIGYHYLITGDGTIRAGRNEAYHGGHCNTRINGVSMNYQSIGICLTGDFTRELISEAQINTLRMTLQDLKEKYNIPLKNILGHKEVPNSHTICPAGLMEWIRNYRNYNFEEALKKRIIILKKIIQLYQILWSLLKKKEKDNNYHN